MAIGLDYWFLLPVGFAVATVAMSAGVSGSSLWIPIFLLWLGLPPRLVFWASLLTMLFGFGSGVLRNIRAATIDWPSVGRYLGFAGPAAVVGTLVVGWLPVEWMLRAFAVFVVFYGAHMSLGAWLQGVDAEAEEVRAPSKRPFWLHAILGGALQGTIATGSGAMVLPAMLEEDLEHHAVAVGSTVLVVFGVSILALAFRFDAQLLDALRADSQTVIDMMVFAIPGAIVGGQVGPRVATRLPRVWLRPYVGVVLVFVGTLVGMRAFG